MKRIHVFNRMQLLHYEVEDLRAMGVKVDDLVWVIWEETAWEDKTQLNNDLKRLFGKDVTWYKGDFRDEPEATIGVLYAKQD